MTEKVLITGLPSLLGTGLITTAPKRFHLTGTYLTSPPSRLGNTGIKLLPLNVTEKAAIAEVIQIVKPTIIIHLAAVSDIDYCQKHRSEAEAVNLAGTRNVVEAAKKADCYLIFMSSVMVFDGRKGDGYDEEDKPQSLNVYGQTKLAAEELVKQSNLKWLIVRLTTLYGWQPKRARLNPISWMLNELAADRKLEMVTDRYTNPIDNLTASKAIWQLIDKKLTGIYHIGGQDVVSRYEWAKAVARVFGYSTKLITPVTSGVFTSLAPRPKYAILKTERIEKAIGYRPPNLVEGLQGMSKK